VLSDAKPVPPGERGVAAMASAAYSFDKLSVRKLKSIAGTHGVRPRRPLEKRLPAFPEGCPRRPPPARR
jgi:hypothetical protein